jgi:transcriptional regulator with XRE-family HTH domain
LPYNQVDLDEMSSRGGEKMNLRDIRKSKGLTMKQVADAAQISEAAVSLYENGKRFPNLSTAYKIAKALDVSIDELIGKKAG